MYEGVGRGFVEVGREGEVLEGKKKREEEREGQK